MTDDGVLLRDYHRRRSEQAFAELARRHLGMVYGAALRRLGGDAHGARDVCQEVFTDLVRKAPALLGRRSLAGWLHIGAVRAAANVRRGRVRRQARESMAMADEEALRSTEPAADWGRMRPVLDEAIGALGEGEREAVLLRFFEELPFAEVGLRLGLSPDAARMRVERALERLRSTLARRGAGVGATSLAGLLAEHAAVAAPPGLAAAVGSAAGTAGGGGAVATAIELMKVAKLQTALLAAVLATGAAVGVRDAQANRLLDAEIASLRPDARALSGLRAEHVRLKRKEAELAASVAAAEAPPAEEIARAGDAAKDGTASKGRPIRTLEEALVRGPIYDADALDRRPVPIDQTPPTFPFDMRRAGLSGKVTVEFVVAADGGVVGARALDSNDSRLTQAAVDAVSQWVFKPGLKDGRAANGRLQVPIVFSLGAAKPTP